MTTEELKRANQTAERNEHLVEDVKYWQQAD